MKKSYNKYIVFALVALFALGGYAAYKKRVASVPVHVPVIVPLPAPAPTAPPAVVPPSLVTMEFTGVPVSEVVAFLAPKLPYHFIVDTVAGDLLSWSEFGLPADKILSSFLRSLDSSGFTVRQEGATFTITKTEKTPTFQPVDFASAAGKLFFFFRGQFYSKADMPVPVRQVGLRWYALHNS